MKTSPCNLYLNPLYYLQGDFKNEKSEINIGRKAAMFPSLYFTPDVKQLIVVIQVNNDNHTIKQWDLASKRELVSFDAGGLPCLSTNRKQAATTNKDNSISLWDVDTGKAIRTFYGHDKKMTNLFFSQDGKKIISISKDNIRIWNL